MRKAAFFLLVTLIISGCSKPNKIENTERALYYWKSDGWSYEGKEDTIIRKLKVRKLYVKFFEVENNYIMGNIPVAKTDLRLYHSDSLNIIPTVYINNDVFLKSSKGAIDTLADNVNFLINKQLKDNFSDDLKITEFQMDCDWTLKTKDNYFLFLRKLKAISKKDISCTLRLYPYKYSEKMGVPPVDSAVLVCYNLMNPLENQNRNSILDVDELAAYLNVKRKYSLHLDIALPIYSWMQVYQNSQFTKVVYSHSEELQTVLKPVKPLWFEITKDTVFDDFYFRVGDKIKYEKITSDKIFKAIEVIRKNVVFDPNTTVILFHLDQEQISQYKDEELSRFYSDFSQ